MEKQRETGALLIAACLIAAIRLRGDDIQPSPRLNAIIKDSVNLARLVLGQLEVKGGIDNNDPLPHRHHYR